MRRAFLVSLLVGFIAAPLRAGPASIDAAPPVQLTRTLRTFDFEERARGNVEDTPVGWMKVEGAGLPRYVHGTLDTGDPATSGTGTFRFDLDGGSVVYRFPGTRTPVMSHARYRVSTMVRTTLLRVARAQLTAYFADANGRPIVSSIRRSAPIVSEATDGDRFRSLSIDLVADDADATSLVVELGLMQPALRDDVTDEAAKLAEDIHGSAWFDDVRIAQIPDVTLRTDRPLNVFAKNEPANLRVGVSDRLTSDLTAEIRVCDADGHPVYQRTGPLAFGTGDDGRARPRVGSIALPMLPPGWYAARLTLRSQGQYIDERSLAFVRLGDAPMPSRSDTRFGLITTDVAPRAWSLLPDAADVMGVGRVKVSVWSKDYGVDGSDPALAPQLDRLLDALADRECSLTACLAGLPPDVRAKLGANSTGDWTDLLTASKDQWQPQLAFLLARHAGPRVRWQVGDDALAERFAREPRLRDAFERVANEYQPLVGNDDLSMPWPALYEIGSQPLPHTVSLTVPSSVLPDQIPLYLADIGGNTPEVSSTKRDVTIALEPIERAKYGRDVQRADLALRIVNALAGGATRIDLPPPMRFTTDDEDGTAGDPPMAEPDELLITQRVIDGQLANARYVGTIRLAPGIEAFVFDRDGVGVMLVHREGNEAAPPSVTLTLGANANNDGGSATMVALDGTVTPLVARANDRDAFELPVGPQPIFITGADASLLRLRASIALDNTLLQSTAGQHSRTLTFVNTFQTPITGTVHLTAPNGWTVSMPSMSFSLNPGETYHGPINITLPASTSAGDRTVLADISVEVYGNGRRITVPLTLRLGLSDVSLQSFAFRDGNELVVQQTITNYGNVPISYGCYAVLPGQARQERIVTDLAPGKSVIRKFRFPKPGPDITHVRSGIRELNGKRMLNQDVDLQGQ